MIARVALMILFNALWLQLLIAFCAGLMLRCLRKSSASTRYGVLCVALVAALVLPVVAALPHANAPAVHENAPKEMLTFATQRVAAAASVTQSDVTTESIAPVPASASWQLPRTDFKMQASVVTAIFFAWLVMMLALVVRLAVSFAHLERLKRNALPLKVDCRERLRRWSESMGSGVRLCVSTETRVPIAIGWFDAMVLIPEHLVEALDDEDLDRIVLHEVAHLRRRDAFVHVMQQLGSALYFFSPGLAWIARQLDLEREVACDDWVVTERGEAAPYASCLVRLAEGTPWPHRALAAPGAFVTRRSMSIRIERILERTRTVRLRPAPGPLAGTLVAMTALGALGVTVAPSIAYPDQPCNQTRAQDAFPDLQIVRTVAYHNEAFAVKHAQSVVKHTQSVVKHVSAVPLPLVTRVTREIALTTPKPPQAVATTRPPEPSDYITGMDAAAGRRLSADELVELKSMGITPDDIKQWRDAGATVPLHDLLAARSVGLTPAMFQAFRSSFGELSFRDAIAMQSMHIDPQFRSRLEAAGLQGLTPRELLALKSLDVTPEYIQQANSLGFGKLDVRQLESLKSMGIDAAYLQRIRDHGFQNLTLRQVLAIKAMGVIK